MTNQSWKTLDNTFKEEYTYDDHGRLTKKTITLPNNTSSEIQLTYGDALGRISTVRTPVSIDYYNYLAGSGTNTTTPLVSALSHNPNGNSLEAFNYLYEYDALGNITKITERSGSAADQIRNYTYDSQSQLLSESYYSGYAAYTYDTYGNIRTKEVTPQFAADTLYEYSYGNTQWRDLLTSIKVTKNGTSNTYSYTYDAIGNPRQYYNVNNSATWNLRWVDGRSLHKAVGNGHTVDYRYGADNIRAQKTVDGVVHEYVYAGGKLLRETYTESGFGIILEFVYDQNDRPYMLYYTSISPDPAVGSTTTVYYYLLNLQGDVVRVVNANGVEVAEYSYDAWGNLLRSSGYMASTNPLRYRGYYYDVETGWYYLQSRYYDPGLGRFINADCYTSTGQGFIGYNMFAYCNNNPVNCIDSSGNYPNICTVLPALVGMTVSYIICAYPSVEQHYARNQLQESYINSLGKTDYERIEYIMNHWDKQPDGKNLYHRFTKGQQGLDARYNVKYLSSDGHNEVVICLVPSTAPYASSYYIVRDPINGGTYNYGVGYLSHFAKDMLPYWVNGNNPTDKAVTNGWDRVFGPGIDPTVKYVYDPYAKWYLSDINYFPQPPFYG